MSIAAPGLSRDPALQTQELIVVAQVVSRIIGLRGEHHEGAITGVAILRSPHHGRYVHTEAGMIERYLRTADPVVDEHVHGAADTDQELVALPVRMLPSHLGRWDPIDDEQPLRNERQALAELGDSEAATHVLGAIKVDQAGATDQIPGFTLRLREWSGRLVPGTNVPVDPGRIAVHDGIWRDVGRNHRASTHHRVSSDRDAGQDCRIRPDRGALADPGDGKLARPLPAAWELVIRERGVRADKDVVVEPDAIPQLHAGLDRDSVTHHDVVLDEDVIADVAARPDAGLW